MRFKFRSIPSAIAAILVTASLAWAANTALSNLSASGAIAGANLLYVVQTAGSGGVKATFTQVATFINSLFSGDFTCASGGSCTLKNTGPGATGPIGSATTTPVITIDAQGRATALTSANIQLPISPNPQTGSNYAILSTDYGKLVNLANASNQIPTIAQAGTTGFASGYFVDVCNQGAGTQTITPTTSTIGGAATFLLPGATAGRPACVGIVSDGTNYQVVPYFLMPGTVIPNVVGTVSTQSGATYTFAATDFGTTVRGSNASAQTFTIPQGLPVGCTIAVEQAGAGKVSVNGSAVTPATLHSAHSYTGTSAQWAVIDIFTESSNVAILTGDGA